MHDDDPGTVSFNPYHHQSPRSDKWGVTNPVEKYREIPRDNKISYTNWLNQGMEDDSTGAESLRLWKTSPSPSPNPNQSPSHPLLSQSSRAEAIVRGRWELMEMVKNMPESSYELSLKDMVEHQSRESGAVGSSASGDGINRSLHQRAVVNVRTDDQSRRSIDRNLSIENKGWFLNMVFPISFKSKKKNNNVKGCAKSERDWWKKKFRGSSDSDSSGISSSSSGAASSSSGGAASGGSSVFGGRKKKGFFFGCWPLSISRSNKSAE